MTHIVVDKSTDNANPHSICLSFVVKFTDISGSQDGSIRMWEFGHAGEITSHRTSGSYQRVTRARFSPHGNKVHFFNLQQ